MPTDLRPLSLGELLDRAFTLYRRHLWLLVGIMAVPSAFGLTLALILAWLQHLMGSLSSPAGPPAPPSPATIVTVLALFAVMMVLVVAYMIVNVIALGALARAASDLYFSKPVTIAGVYRGVRGQVPSLMFLMVLMLLRVGGLVFAGLVFVTIGAGLTALVSPVVSATVLIVGGIGVGSLSMFMLVRYGVAVPALVLEDLRARGAILRSIHLTTGHRWRVLATGVCSAAVAYALIALLQGPFLVGSMIAGPDSRRGFLLHLVGTVTGAISGTFTGPVAMVALALLYYDTRVRHEAFDLDVMIHALDRQTARPSIDA